MQETWVWFLDWEDSLEKEMAIHSIILAWRIPWSEELSRLQSMGSQELDTTERLGTLVSTVQQSGSAICIHISLPAWTSSHTPSSHPQVITEHWPELPVLYGSFPLAAYFIHGRIYMSILLSQFISSSLFPPLRDFFFFKLYTFLSFYITTQFNLFLIPPRHQYTWRWLFCAVISFFLPLSLSFNPSISCWYLFFFQFVHL